jgi:hypothetical protein
MLLVLAACTQPESEPRAFTPAFSTVQDEGLTDDADAALARMPAWLQPDLRLAFAQLVDDADQDRLADVILGVEDPNLLDEVGFAAAHLSPGVLGSKNFYPQLLVENAELIYEVDPSLDYVELVEDGVAGVDADWRTTVRYQVETDGVQSTIDLDPALYYWFIVHPRLEDENPWYIDAWSECTRSTLECAADPDTGTFWRRFLWDAATETCPEGASCPIAADYLPGAALLYGAADQDDAVHRVAGMMLDSPNDTRWFNFGAYGERSIQPNRIYALGRGNCGEWADMTSAISRTVLIPNVNVTPSSWDHTWNAFALGDEWIAWEPVNWWFDHDYASGYATYATRGDTSMWYQTEQYTADTATLDVQVVDEAGAPVDGASVVLWTPYGESFWYAGEQVTGLDGLAEFTVGADQEVAWGAISDVGGDGSLQGPVFGIAAGGTETVVTTVDGAVPVAATPGISSDAGLLSVDVSVSAEGRKMGDTYGLGDRSSQPSDAPALTTWVMSWDDYAKFTAGEAFSTQASLHPVEGGVVVVGNFASVGTAAVGELTLTTSGDRVTSATETRPFALLPGAWIAVGVSE